MENVDCPICELDNSIFLWNKNHANYVKCMHCSLVYENPRLTSEELRSYYSNESYFLSNDKQDTSSYTDYFSQCNIGLNKEYFSILQQYVQNKLSIKYLDIGCGPGTLVKLASENGWDATGLEISKWAAEYARHNRINVIENNLQGANFSSDCFDLISMFDVLEHLPDPVSYVREIFRILKSQGIVIVETPNVGGFFSKYLYKQNSEIVKPRAHICLYSPSSIQHLFSKVDFSKIKINTFPYCRKYTPGYFKSLFTSRLGPNSQKRQLTINESIRIIAWK